MHRGIRTCPAPGSGDLCIFDTPCRHGYDTWPDEIFTGTELGKLRD